MALPNHTPLNYRIWHYTYLTFCGLVFFFLIAPLFVILPLSFNAEQYIHFSAKMLST
jgi:putative spermidine/putrescine transport system permease protein